MLVLILTVEFAFGLGYDFGWGKMTIHCWGPVTNVFQLKIHLAEVGSCVLCV
jgi:hypothetical protein